jgi:serine/threonine protein kinase
MATISSCPTDAAWRRFLLGRLADTEAVRLEEHLSTCHRCGEAFHALRTDDTLIEALRQQAVPGDDTEERLVEDLVGRLKELRPPAAGQDVPEEAGSTPVGATLIDEGARLRFEAAWRQNQPQPIEAFLPPPEQPNHLPTLEELVLVEMEFTWKKASGDLTANRPALVEAYLARFPQLDQPERVLRLLRQEYHLRQQFGDRPALEEYRTRFPQLVSTGREVEGATLDSAAARLEQLAAQCQEPAAGRVPGSPEETLTDPAEDAIDFLVPPEGPGELGRLGHFRVLEVLGKGGMGIVFRAEDTHLRREVALKTMRPSIAARPSERARFLREAQLAASVSHDHIVPIFHVGEDRGVPFLAMPLLTGQSLEDSLNRQRGPWPVAEVLRIGQQVAEGLAAAHERGLIHRDIKPANVWLEKVAVRPRSKASLPSLTLADSLETTTRVRLLDFGLARSAADAAHLTASGAILGTPAYMAPEQAYGEKVDARCDLFSLGCVLYRMCTGRLPFQGENTMSVLVALATAEPPSPASLNPAVPPALSELVMRLLAKDRQGRPESAAAVADEMEALRHLLCPPVSSPTAMLPSPVATPVASGVEGGSTRSINALTFPSPAAGVPVRRRPRWRGAVVAALLLALLGAGGWYFAGPIVRIATNRGQIVIEGDDPGMEVTVKEKGAVIQDPAGQRVITVAAGEHDLEVTVRDAAGEVRFFTRQLTLSRGGKQVLNVREELAQAPTPNAKPAPGAAAQLNRQDREKPFVLLQPGGGRDEFTTLERALQLLGDDNVLEVHGNGPFYLYSTALKDKRLVLRAGPGYRPQIHGRVKDQPLLQLDGVRLTLDGCDFRLPNGPQSLLAGTGPAWEFNNCRFLIGPGGGGSGMLVYRGPRLAFSNCLIFYPSHWNHGVWMRAGPGVMGLEITNCLMLVGGRSILPIGSDCDWKVSLNKNTIIISGLPLPDLDKATNVKMDVRASGNIFHLNHANGNAYAWPLVTAWKDKVHWKGDHNLYVGVKEGLALWHDREGKKKTYGLAGWNELWGEKEPGSAEAPLFYPSWRKLYQVDSAKELLAAAKEVLDYRAALPPPEEKGRVEGSGPVGPNWDIVGPGDAYVRALAARGEAVPEGKLRPKPIEGAAFVVLREGQVVRDFLHLREAVDFAKSGDVVELRTDRTIEAEDLSQAQGPKHLTIRAAPGYTPVVRGFRGFTNVVLSVEGLHFQGGGFWSLSETNLHLARVVNCTFSCPRDVEESWPVVVHGPLFIPTPTDAPLEIVNCVLPGGIFVLLHPGSRIVVRNSLVGWFWLSGEAGKSIFEIDRSVLWRPPTLFAPNDEFCLGVKAKEVTPELILRDSLVENATRFILNGDHLKKWKWIGQHNVYRLGEQAWCNSTPDGTPPPTSLARWQTLWGSDADSVRLDPQVYDPLQWKLLSGTAGFKQGPDGKDLGADVSRIGVVSGTQTRAEFEQDGQEDGGTFEGWVKATSVRKPTEQVWEVERKLKERNAGFKAQPKWEYASDGAVTGFEVQSDDVTDLSPLRALPRLVHVRYTGFGREQGRLADLSCLRGLQLTHLICAYAQFDNLEPLRGMNLEFLDCSWSRVKDLSPLRGMKLTALNCGYSKVEDLSPLKGIPLTALNCEVTPVSNLEPLRSMKLTGLNCDVTPVRDLTPLTGMPLQSLRISRTEVTDLSPLKGTLLTYLDCRLEGRRDLDLSPLAGLPLKVLDCDFRPTRDTAVLRSIKTLETINGKPAAEFWKKVPASEER